LPSSPRTWLLSAEEPKTRVNGPRITPNHPSYRGPLSLYHLCAFVEFFIMPEFTPLTNPEEQKRRVAEEIGRWLDLHASDFIHRRGISDKEAGWREEERDRSMFHGADRAEAFRILFDAHAKGWPVPGSDWIAQHFENAWYRDDHGAHCRELFAAFRPVWDAWRFALEAADQLRRQS